MSIIERYEFTLEPGAETVGLVVSEPDRGGNKPEKIRDYLIRLTGDENLAFESGYDFFEQFKENLMDFYGFERVHDVKISRDLDTRDTYAYVTIVNNNLQIRSKHPEFVRDFVNKVLSSGDGFSRGIKIQYKHMLRRDKRDGKISIRTDYHL